MCNVYGIIGMITLIWEGDVKAHYHRNGNSDFK